MIFLDLIYNLSMLIALSVVSGFAGARWPVSSRKGAVLQGLVFGVAACLGMLKPFVYAPGLVFDGRSVMISLCGLFFGSWAAAVSCLLTIPLRVVQGGDGMWMGILVILASAAIGVGFHRRRMSEQREVSVLFLLGFGVLVHLAMLVMTGALPNHLIIPVLKRIGPPVMLTYPLATVLVGKILSDQSARFHYLRELQESESKYRRLYDSIMDAFILVDLTGRIRQTNQSFQKMVGYTESELFLMSYQDLTPEKWRSLDARIRDEQVLVRGYSDVYEKEYHHKNGGCFPIELRTFLLRDVDGNPAGMWAIARDITARKNAEAALMESRTMLQQVLDTVPQSIFWKDIESVYQGCNHVFAEAVGLSDASQIVGKTDYDLPWPRQEADAYRADDAQVIRSGVPKSHIIEPLQQADGTRLWIDTTKKPLVDDRQQVRGVLGVYEDITDRKRAEEAIRASLIEKEVLLKEVHHRVKNNMQIISSLLNLQARQVQSADVERFVREIQGRIMAMALLHETLYSSGNLARVQFKRYAEKICASLIRSYATENRCVRLKTDVADVGLSLDQAIPAGLIINELVSNALKHAFVGRQQGELLVMLNSADDSHYALSVRDDGVGLPDLDSTPGKTNSLGLHLVRDLTRQLHGELVIEKGPGTLFRIVFPRQADDSPH